MKLNEYATRNLKKSNLILNESYDSKFRNIINYVKKLMPDKTNWSYDDYRVVGDDFGGGIRFQIEFDSKDPSLKDKIMNSIEDHFYGVRCSSGWGRDWDYYVSVEVSEKACRESVNKLSTLTLNEDWFDDDNFIVDDTITDEAPEKESPKNEVDTGISNLLIDAIKDEFETIKLYNSIIEQIRVEGREDIISILQDIVNEENVHVGQLQKALELYSPNADSIEHGSQEAEEQMKVELISEGIKNLDRVVSGKKMDVDVDIPLDMADAIVAHEQTEKDIKDAMKEVEDSAKEVSDKKETKKVSTPAMKKMKLSEELFTEDSDGWDIVHTSFNKVLDRINDLDYEIKNCIKGAYTNCYSYEELGEYIRQLGMDLMDSADEISELSDEDEFEESLTEGRKPEELSLFDQVYNELSMDVAMDARSRKISNKEFPNKKRFRFDDEIEFDKGFAPEKDLQTKHVDARNAKVEPDKNAFILDVSDPEKKEFVDKVSRIYNLQLLFKGDKAYLQVPEE